MRGNLVMRNRVFRQDIQIKYEENVTEGNILEFIFKYESE